jgi:hypothetical protein
MNDIKLDGEIADSIARTVLEQHMELINSQITELLHTENLSDVRKDDLSYNIALRHHLSAVMEYFGG